MSNLTYQWRAKKYGWQAYFTVIWISILSADNFHFLILQGLDWNQPDIDHFMSSIDSLDYILAADVFYDVKVFKPLVQTIALILRRYLKAVCIFAYEERE